MFWANIIPSHGPRASIYIYQTNSSKRPPPSADERRPKPTAEIDGAKIIYFFLSEIKI